VVVFENGEKMGLRQPETAFDTFQAAFGVIYNGLQRRAHDCHQRTASVVCGATHEMATFGLR